MLPLILALLAPVTQAEALAFHASGRCQMMEPGQGITRPDGRGWITSMLPGPHRLVNATPANIDFTPGRAVKVIVTGPVEWCPAFKPADRDECGPVPPAFLYDAKLATDPR